jgi:hypothetical protein
VSARTAAAHLRQLFLPSCFSSRPAFPPVLRLTRARARYWLRLPKHLRSKLWTNLGDISPPPPPPVPPTSPARPHAAQSGWFVLLGFVGNVSGAIARNSPACRACAHVRSFSRRDAVGRGAIIAELQQFYQLNHTLPSQRDSAPQEERTATWFAAYVAAQSVEALCLGVCKAMLLSRLIAHASLPLKQLVFPPWHSNPVWMRRFGRFLIVIASTCGIVGVVANTVAASRAAASARLWAAAAADGSDSGFKDKCTPALSQRIV